MPQHLPACFQRSRILSASVMLPTTTASFQCRVRYRSSTQNLHKTATAGAQAELPTNQTTHFVYPDPSPHSDTQLAGYWTSDDAADEVIPSALTTRPPPIPEIRVNDLPVNDTSTQPVRAEKRTRRAGDESTLQTKSANISNTGGSVTRDGASGTGVFGAVSASEANIPVAPRVSTAPLFGEYRTPATSPVFASESNPQPRPGLVQTPQVNSQSQRPQAQPQAHRGLDIQSGAQKPLGTLDRPRVSGAPVTSGQSDSSTPNTPANAPGTFVPPRREYLVLAPRPTHNPIISTTVGQLPPSPVVSNSTTTTEDSRSIYATSTRKSHGPPPPLQNPLPTTTPSTIPPGPKVGELLPDSLHLTITAINALTKQNKNQHPLRLHLKNASSVLPYAETEALREHFHGSTGMMKKSSLLRKWYGDESVLPLEVWEFLVVQVLRPGRRKGAQSVNFDEIDTP